MIHVPKVVHQPEPGYIQDEKLVLDVLSITWLENLMKTPLKKNTNKYYENIMKHVFVVNLRPVVDVILAVVVRMWLILDVFTVRQIPSIDSWFITWGVSWLQGSEGYPNILGMITIQGLGT